MASQVMREGSDITLVAFGKMVGYNLKAAEMLEKDGISCEVGRGGRGGRSMRLLLQGGSSCGCGERGGRGALACWWARLLVNGTSVYVGHLKGWVYYGAVLRRVGCA